MKLHLTKTKDGDGYISIFLNEGNQSVVCKPVHGFEVDDLLNGFKENKNLLIEQKLDDKDCEYSYFISEKPKINFKKGINGIYDLG